MKPAHSPSGPELCWQRRCPWCGIPPWPSPAAASWRSWRRLEASWCTGHRHPSGWCDFFFCGKTGKKKRIIARRCKSATKTVKEAVSEKLLPGLTPVIVRQWQEKDLVLTLVCMWSLEEQQSDKDQKHLAWSRTEALRSYTDDRVRELTIRSSLAEFLFAFECLCDLQKSNRMQELLHLLREDQRRHSLVLGTQTDQTGLGLGMMREAAVDDEASKPHPE